MPRTIWKGAITFGLVYIPVALRAASRDQSLDFDWLDRRDMAPVGYKRINKRTGEQIESENIVKGYKYEPDQYVLMTDEDFKQANPEATQTIEILNFVDVAEVSPAYFVTPYYLEAMRRGEKGYALLRQVLRDSGRAGLARVVIHSKQRLATLMVQDEWLMLNTMRFADEVLPAEDMVPVDEAFQKSLDKRELDMAQRLVDEMTTAWDPAQYRDTYREDLLQRIEARIDAGETHELAPAAEEAPRAEKGAKVIDLMAALRESLDRRGGAKGGAKRGGGDKESDSPAGKRAARGGESEEPEEDASDGEEHSTAKPRARGAKAPAGETRRTATRAAAARKTSAAKTTSTKPERPARASAARKRA
jgi:DNA end-binding protein Ku